ncbi:MAG TPA: hypothetical protein VFB95_09895 [Candidatus Cryosericum sp.]|nr:hypothetical protein [Candidatus Cryosericum sp.]
MSPNAQETAKDESDEIEAEYALEAPATCPSCKTKVASVQVVRLLRTRVNFTSSLPRRGYAVVCPSCRTFIPAAIGGILG